MHVLRAINRTTGQVLAERVAVADTAWRRFVGLQGRRDLPASTGLLLLPCSSIHMLFMRFRIDAVFATRDGHVVKIGRRLRPWTLGPIAPGALYCLELPAGAADTSAVGHVIELAPAAEHTPAAVR